MTLGMIFVFVAEASPQRQMEKLGRGVVAINQSGGKVYVGWRLLGTDRRDIAFNVYTVINGSEGKPSVQARVWSHNYLSIPLQTMERYTLTTRLSATWMAMASMRLYYTRQAEVMIMRKAGLQIHPYLKPTTWTAFSCGESIWEETLVKAPTILSFQAPVVQ